MDDTVITLAGKIDMLLTQFVEIQRNRGYFHLQELEDAVEDLRTHLL